MKFICSAILFVAVGLFTSCTPEVDGSAPTGSVDFTPREVEITLNSFVEDLGRILAVTEPLEDDVAKQAHRLLQDDSLQSLVDWHVAEIEAMAVKLRVMAPEDRAAFAATIQPAARSIESKMQAVCSSGPAAQDAFAPRFVAIQEALRSSL